MYVLVMCHENRNGNIQQRYTIIFCMKLKENVIKQMKKIKNAFGDNFVSST